LHAELLTEFVGVEDTVSDSKADDEDEYEPVSDSVAKLELLCKAVGDSDEL
jgi:hypothetical protein